MRRVAEVKTGKPELLTKDIELQSEWGPLARWVGPKGVDGLVKAGECRAAEEICTWNGIPEGWYSLEPGLRREGSPRVFTPFERGASSSPS